MSPSTGASIGRDTLPIKVFLEPEQSANPESRLIIYLNNAPYYNRAGRLGNVKQTAETILAKTLIDLVRTSGQADPSGKVKLDRETVSTALSRPDSGFVSDRDDGPSYCWVVGSTEDWLSRQRTLEAHWNRRPEHSGSTQTLQDEINKQVAACFEEPLDDTGYIAASPGGSLELTDPVTADCKGHIRIEYDLNLLALPSKTFHATVRCRSTNGLDTHPLVKGLKNDLEAIRLSTDPVEHLIQEYNKNVDHHKYDPNAAVWNVSSLLLPVWRSKAEQIVAEWTKQPGLSDVATELVESRLDPTVVSVSDSDEETETQRG